jgi:single-strand selective monofunctional uracil DNA glycosylase
MLDAARQLANDSDALSFSAPAAYVMNPLRYAWDMHARYITRFGSTSKRVVFIGMNPGPYGMMQTGVPFGAMSIVRDWFALEGQVDVPVRTHPKRPITGLSTTREEVSGARLYGLFRARFGTPDAFFADHYVANWCPLAFLDDGARNVTPDKLKKSERARLEEVCDRHLARVIDALAPTFVIGVGKFAEARAKAVIDGAMTTSRPRVLTILHPSPASPLANAGFEGKATEALVDAGVWS